MIGPTARLWGKRAARQSERFFGRVSSLFFFFHAMKSPRSWLEGRIPAQLMTLLEELAGVAVAIAKFAHLCVERAWASSLFFSVIFISLIVSKCFHILAYIDSMPFFSLLVWGSTFFIVDFLFIVVACLLSRSFGTRIARNVAAVVTGAFGFVSDPAGRMVLFR